MSISSVGKTRFKIYGALLLVDIIILGLSGHINQFQEFYYKADLVPFGLALATAIWLSLMIFLDVRSKNATTARPAFELTWLCIMNLLWLGFNAFSTNRWRSIGWSLCKTIPDGDQYSPYRTWCKEVQGVRAFIWVEWILLLISFTYLLHWTLKQHHSGRKDVWSTSFSRFQDMQSRPATRAASEFLQWEKFEQSGGSLPVTQAPSPLNNPIDPFHPGYAVEPTVSRDSSIPPMGTAYGRAQYAQRHQQQQPQAHAQIYDNAYANDSYQVDGAEHSQYGHGSQANVSGYPIGQYGGPAHGF